MAVKYNTFEINVISLIQYIVHDRILSGHLSNMRSKKIKINSIKYLHIHGYINLPICWCVSCKYEPHLDSMKSSLFLSKFQQGLKKELGLYAVSYDPILVSILSL